ncbi:MAG TPA: histidine phosphatase family protein [Candidatus Dormibacteraeota bacterium]|nr:histidine phosphatase family protein [Candidatus Dormibacteraeota bacterium]
MSDPSPAPARSAFLHALGRLHERFLVDVDGVTEVWLIRHGDAYGELVSLDDSDIDPPLSPRGRREARALGGRLEAAGVSAIWASGIARAQETAALAALPSGLSVQTDHRLREVKTHWEDAGQASPPPDGYIPFVEPVGEVVERMDSAVRDIAASVTPGSRIAAVTHAGAITFYLTHLLRLDSGPLRVLPRFTSVTVLLIKDGRIVVQSIGDVAHLAGEQVTG